MTDRDYEIGLAIVRNRHRMYSGLKKRQYDYYIHRLTPAAGQEKAFDAVQSFTDKFIAGQNPTGLLFIGGVGSGKTLMTTSTANNIIDTKIEITESEIENAAELPTPKGYSFWGISHKSPVQFISVIDLMNQLKACFNDPDSGVQYKIMERLQEVDLLILDDMGAEKSSDWVCEKLFEIIDYRYNQNSPLLVTTNNIPEELKKQIGARNFDRLREMCALVTVSAKSQRPTATII
jgi:DNA replication protein DnaC